MADSTLINITIPPPTPVTVNVTAVSQPVLIEVSEDIGNTEVTVQPPPATPVEVQVVPPAATPVTVVVNEVGEKGDPGPPGTSGSLDNLLFGETPIGNVDGSNATFTSPVPFIPGKVEVFINGLLQKLVTHYQTIGANTIIFNDSPQPSDLILLNYIKS